MSYRFALASVLRLREGIEERDLHRLEQIQHEIARTVQLLDALKIQEGDEMATRERELRTGIAAAHLQVVEEMQRTVRERQKALEKNLGELQVRRQQQLDIYEAAKRDRQVLSELRDRQREAYQTKHAREQQKLLDDIFLSRHGKS